MIDKYASSLQKGAKGNARNVDADEVVGGVGAVALAASNVLLALGVDEVGDTDEDYE
jgi:hypothetical protein